VAVLARNFESAQALHEKVSLAPRFIPRGRFTPNIRSEVTAMKIPLSITGCLVAVVLLAAPRVLDRQIPAPASNRQQNPAPSNSIKMTVGLVVLHATTENKKGVSVSGLDRDDFQVFEDGVAQRIETFSHEDVPVTVGLVVDGSGSMRPKRADVLSAAQTFVRASNVNDEMFVVNFNEYVSLGLPDEVPFTSKPAALQLALAQSPVSGQTALYDAMAAALQQLKRGSRDKKVLIVISDGGDNASTHSNLKQTMTLAVESNAVIYTIGLFDESDVERNPGVLKQLAHATGGEFFQPETVSDVVPLCAQIARDIREQYTIAYTPTNAAQDGAYRAIQVRAKAAGQNHLVVRTRPGYYAPGARSQSAPNAALRSGRQQWASQQ
jgi:Ca-activated chloride channel homolog